MYIIQTNAKAQVLKSEQLWVHYEANFSLEETINRVNDPYHKEGLSFSKDVNNLFLKHSVIDYKKAIPYSKNPKLLDVYAITCLCDINSLSKELKSLLSNNIIEIKIIDSDGEEELLYNPNDAKWQDYINGISGSSGLWYLERIQAPEAWDITKGNPNVKAAVIDNRLHYNIDDLSNGKLFENFDLYSGISMQTTPNTSTHGTNVAMFTAANTDNSLDVASTGFNTSIIPFANGGYGRSSTLLKSHYASLCLNAKVAVNAASPFRDCPDTSGMEQMMIKEVLDNGTAIFTPAGNNINVCKQPCLNGGFTTTIGNGTSFAAPITAGVAALMYDVYPCISSQIVKDILTDPVNLDPIVDAANFVDANGQSLVGEGRLNAFKAVNKALSEYNLGLNVHPNLSSTVNSNTTINDGNIYDVVQDILVTSGNTLSISNGTTLKMADKVKITIEAGAKLEINNATLTTQCEDVLWTGIVVNGAGNQEPHPAKADVVAGIYPDPVLGALGLNHGVVHIHGSSKIERAVNGVKSVKVITGNDWPNAGGIIIAEDSEFINNLCALIFNGFINGEHIFEANNCNFLINDDFIAHNYSYTNTKPEAQILTNDANSFKIIDCIFQNNYDGVHLMYNNTYVLKTETAIRSYYSTYEVSGCTVNNFKTGIEAYNGGASLANLSQMLIKNNVFNSNEIAIDLSGLGSSLLGDSKTTYIHNNEINLIKQSKGEYNNLGIHIEGTTDYTIEDNDFAGGYQKADNSYSGISIAAFASDDFSTCYIKDNQIGDPNSKLQYGIFCISDNSSLQILCNNFEDNTMEMGLVLTALPGAQGFVIDEVQGNCDQNTTDTQLPETYPTGNDFAGNNFNTPNVGQHRQINAINISHQIIYNYYDQDGPPDITYASNVIIPNGACTNIEFDQRCGIPTNSGPGIPICNTLAVERFFNDLEMQISEIKILLTKYNREDISAIINQAEDINEIVALIEQFNTYLSDEELIAITRKFGNLNTSLILDIIEENTPVSEAVLNEFNFNIANLPRIELFQFRNRIDDIRHPEGNNLSSREYLEIEIYQLIKTQKIKLAPQIANCWKNGNKRSVIALINRFISQSSQNEVYFRKLLIYLLAESELY